jgi:hypothetical protein
MILQIRVGNGVFIAFFFALPEGRDAFQMQKESLLGIVS